MKKKPTSIRIQIPNHAASHSENAPLAPVAATATAAKRPSLISPI
ncbi:MAG: hypothetical protein R2825_14810 [Saprospiraceae bacterium]